VGEQFRITTRGTRGLTDFSPASALEGEVLLDPMSARDLDFFVARVAPTSGDVITRPVLMWRGDRRVVVDVRARYEDGVWSLELGEERTPDAAPDRPEVVDPLLDDLATPVWLTDADRLARWFNTSWCEFVGSALDDELGWGWMRHIHPDDLVGLLTAYEAAQVEHRGFDHVGRLADRDGRFWWARVRAVPRMVGPEFEGFFGICTITDLADGTPPAPSEIVSLLPPLESQGLAAIEVVERLQQIEANVEVRRRADSIEAVLLRRLASRWVKEHHALAKRYDDIVVAVGEATANAALHAYGDEPGVVQLSCADHGSYAEFRVRDWGSWSMPSLCREGRGVRLMGILADEFSLSHDRDGTEVVLRYWF
jgi:anti-sigma regulatory factor (Ser/Thr protein kinase)/PAS domain-containing protein